jgi:hypothetical protein
VFGILASSLNAQHLRLGSDGTVIVIPSYSVRADSRSLIGGPTLAWEFNERFSLETNSIYRRLRLKDAGPTVTWHLPVLAKYRFPLGRVSPLLELEAGPAFRTTGNLNTNPSHTGLTAGTGAGLEWRGLRLEPTLRYTRWTADPAWTTPSKQDQLELLFGVSRGTVTNRHPFGRRVSLGGCDRGDTGASRARRQLHVLDRVLLIPWAARHQSTSPNATIFGPEATAMYCLPSKE